MSGWAANYVGLPWLARGQDAAGVDCYGLVRAIYREIIGVDIPSYAGAYITADEREEIAALVSGARAKSPWTEVDVGAERAFDVALFRMGKIVSHIGLVVSRGTMIHADQKRGVVVDRYSEYPWRGRLSGFQRHEHLAR